MEDKIVDKSKQRRVRALKILIGIILGGTAGYLYYYFFGCDGTCAITSSPIRSILYGSVMGTLLGSAF